MEEKMILYRYMADAKEKPEDIYQYVQEHGTKEPIWTYNNLMDAMRALPDFESTCEKVDGKYKVTCYAIEQER